MTADIPVFSTAIFPPVNYMAIVASVEEILIETCENYVKQSFRNRYQILSANGVLSLTIPVLLGSFHKTALKDIKIDYSRRWQQVHLGAIVSSYRAAPFFEYYFDYFDKILNKKTTFLLDLNTEALNTILKIMDQKVKVRYTESFIHHYPQDIDFRNRFSPKIKVETGSYGKYYQVFEEKTGFVPFLSILDLLFNAGPDTTEILSAYK